MTEEERKAVEIGVLIGVIRAMNEIETQGDDPEQRWQWLKRAISNLATQTIVPNDESVVVQ